MTDKVIIDGVDVVKCNFRCYIDRCMAHSCTTKPCKDNPNCYYKQLQRKEQECDELKEQLKEAKAMNLALDLLEREKEPNHYKQALEKIKTEIMFLYYSTIPFHRGITHEMADLVQFSKTKILNIINEV